VQLDSVQDTREAQSATEKTLHIESLICRANALDSRVEIVEGAVLVATEDIRTCMDSNRGIVGIVSELESRIDTVESAQTRISPQRDLEELQNAVMLLTDSVDGKADRSQLLCLEEKLGDAQVKASEQQVSANMLDAVSEKLEQLAGELAKTDGKTRDAVEAVISLSSDVKAVSQQVEGIQVSFLLSVLMKSCLRACL
jgi:hypothetical protein